MRNMLLCLVLLPSMVLAAPKSFTYSRIVFFGDSLSDIGNMPESPNLVEATYKQIALNLFVPISNPIFNPKEKSYTVVGTSHTHQFPEHAPQPQPPLTLKKESQARGVYSLNWTQYFVQDAKEAHLLRDATVWPWFWWKTHPHHPDEMSINYAWAGAVTDNGCRDFMYQHPSKTCNEVSILAGQAAYRQAGFNPKKQASVGVVQVPGIDRQIQLFLQDSVKSPELADANTLYVILIGGNDLNLSLFDLKEHHFISGFTRVLGGASKRVWQGIQTLVNERGARHIVLFNLFDTSQLPYLQTEIWKTGVMPIKYKPTFISFSRKMTMLYNKQLAKVVHDIQRRYNHKVDIQLFDLFKTMGDAQNLSTFSSAKTLYQTCLGASMDRPISYYTDLNVCRQGDDRYLFWNGAHPASYLHQIIADKLVGQLTQHKNQVALQRKKAITPPPIHEWL